MQQNKPQSQRGTAQQQSATTNVNLQVPAPAATRQATSSAAQAAPSIQQQTGTRVPEVPPRIALWKDVSSAAQSTLTSLAIIAATIWFFFRRQHFPHANVKHEVKYWYVSGRLVLHVAVAVSNVGEVVLRLKQMSMRVQQVLPTPEKVLASIAGGEDPVSVGETEILWPDIAKRECKWRWWHTREIEPDETDEFHFSFALPADVKAVEVYTHIHNRAKRFKPIGWNTNTFWAFKASGVFTPEDHASDSADFSSKET
jgi:hypothetical protein